MANYANLLAQIAANIYSNNNQEITGDGLQLQLNAMVASLGAGYQFMGVAHPADTPSGYSDLRAFWLAGEAGTYTNFGGLVLNDGEVAILKYNGSWSKEVTGAATAAQLTELGREMGDIQYRQVTFVQDKSIYGLRYPPVDVSSPMSDNPGMRCAFVPVSPGEKVTINATGVGVARTWGFVNANGEVLTNSGYSVYEYVDFEVAAPPSSAYLVINDANTGGECHIGETIKELIDNSKSNAYIDGPVIGSWADISPIYQKYIAENGQEYSSAYRWMSDFIMVKEGSTITYQNLNLNLGGTVNYGIACYDKDKNFISDKGVKGSTSNLSGSFVVDSEITYVKISDYVNSSATFSIQTIKLINTAVATLETDVERIKQNGVSLLQDKTIAMFGDSIYEIAGSTSGARKRISDYLAEYTNANILNFGFGGSSICNTHTSSPNYAKFDLVNLLPAVVNGDLSEQETAAAAISSDWVTIVQNLATFDFANCDIVILGYGINDYDNGSTIDGIKAQLAVSLRMIFEANPQIHVILDLPHYRVWNSPDNFVDDAYTHTNSFGKTLGEYCEAIAEAGAQFGVVSNPNLYNSGWNQYNMGQYFFHADGVHFLSNACEICAGRLFDTLNRQEWK